MEEGGTNEQKTLSEGCLVTYWVWARPPRRCTRRTPDPWTAAAPGSCSAGNRSGSHIQPAPWSSRHKTPPAAHRRRETEIGNMWLLHLFLMTCRWPHQPKTRETAALFLGTCHGLQTQFLNHANTNMLKEYSLPWPHSLAINLLYYWWISHGCSSTELKSLHHGIKLQ